MRRITAICTALLLLVTMTAVPVFAEVTGSETLEIPAGVNGGGNIAVWSTYMFFTGESGIEVVDVKGGIIEGSWTFTNGEIPGVSSFIPAETLVTDDYILTSNGSSIAVFENAKGFSDSIPNLVCRMVKDYESSLIFGSIRKMMIIEDTLYIFERAADGEAKLYKMSLSGIGDIAYEDEDLKVISAELNSESVSLGYCDYMWSKSKVDADNAYIVLYNDETTAPNKTLTLKKVNLETLEVSEVELLSQNVTGLFAEVTVEEGTTAEAFEECSIGMTGSETSVPFDALVSANYVDITIDGTKAQIKIVPEALTAFASIFGCTTTDIEDGLVTFKIDYNGQAYIFTYSDNEDKFESGTIATDDDYIYIHTNSTSTDNRLIVVAKNDLRIINSRPAMAAQGMTGANDMFVMDDILVALYRNADTMAVTYDISNPGNIPYNAAANIRINGTMKTGDHVEFLKWGNGYYYLATGTNGVGVIRTDEETRTVEVSYSDGKMPIKLYGFGVDGETISISIDGETEVSTVADNGLWSYDIHAIAEGEHEFEVENGRVKTITVDSTAEAPVDITVECDGTDIITISVTNNTDNYAKVFQSNTFVIHSVVYSKEGELLWTDDYTLNSVSYGSTREYTPWLLVDYNAGDRVEVMVTDSFGNPVTATVYIAGADEVTYDTLPDVYGNIGEITAEVKKIDYQNRKLTVQGNVETDSSRLVLIRVTGDTVAMGTTKAVETDEDGNFEFVYEYGPDYQFADATYDITVNAFGGGEDNAADISYTVMYKGDFDAAVAEITETVADGEALITYLGTNTEFAKTIGVDFESEDYIALSNTDKIALMDDILDEIKGGSQNVSKTFEDGAKELRTKEREAEALAALKAETTTKATLTGILEEYNDVFQIPEDLWKEYTSHKKIQSINKEFLKNDITDVSKVADKLEDAIEEIDNPDDPVDNGGGGGGGKVNPTGSIGGTLEIDVSIANGNATNGYNKYFDDIATVDWAVEAINYLADLGIVSGTGGKVFAPNNNVTREEFVKMLVEALGLYDSAAETDFTDVNAGHWAYGYIASAQKCGLTKGMDGNMFGLGQMITREEMATMAYRAMLLSGKSISAGNVNFADKNEISAYATEAVGAMSNAGILNGVGDNVFAPKGICSRAMAAKVVYEIIN